MDEDILINGYPLSKWGARSHLDYTIGETPITNDIFQGINRTNWFVLRSAIGLRDISITITFIGKNLHEAKILRSKLNAELLGKCEIYIPDDGFYYTAMLVKSGAEELIGIGEKEAQVKSTYTFKGVRHGPLQKITVPQGASSVYCDSTVPFTDCRVILPIAFATSGYVSVNDASANFTGITNSSMLRDAVFDGINNLITFNGGNWASKTTWKKWPKLKPGYNYVGTTSAYVWTIEYFPTYL